MKNIDEARNHLIEEINLNELMSKKYKRKLWFWIILSTYLYQFFSWHSYRNYKFCNRVKNLLITAEIKKYKSIIKKKKKKHDKIVLLAKSKLNSTEVLISEV